MKNIRARLNWRIFSFIAATTVLAISPAEANCDAQILQALKTQYNIKEQGTISKSLYEAACNKSAEASSTSIDVPIPKFGNLGFGQSSNSVAAACAKKDLNFFNTYKSDLTYSYLPEAAIEQLGACLGGLRFKAQQKGNSVILQAAYYDASGGAPDTAEVVELLYDRAALECKGGLLTSKGSKIIPGGVTTNCKRIDKNSTVAVTLNTNKGSKSVWLQGASKIPLNWGYKTKDSHFTKCELSGTLVGNDWTDCRKEGTCESRLAIIGMCYIRHGYAYEVSGGDTKVLKDNIDYRTKNKHVTRCLVNGKPVGKWIDCRKDNTCSRRLRIMGKCAHRHYVGE